MANKDYNPRLASAQLQSKKRRNALGYDTTAKISFELREVGYGEHGARDIADASKACLQVLSGESKTRVVVKRVATQAPTKAREQDRDLILRLAKELSATKPWREFVASGTWNQQTVQAAQALDVIGTLLNQWWLANGDK